MHIWHVLLEFCGNLPGDWASLGKSGNAKVATDARSDYFHGGLACRFNPFAGHHYLVVGQLASVYQLEIPIDTPCIVQFLYNGTKLPMVFHELWRQLEPAQHFGFLVGTDCKVVVAATPNPLWDIGVNNLVETLPGHRCEPGIFVRQCYLVICVPEAGDDLGMWMYARREGDGTPLLLGLRCPGFNC